MVSFNHWLSSIKTNTLSRYFTLFNANHASSNWAEVVKIRKKTYFDLFSSNKEKVLFMQSDGGLTPVAK